MAGKGVQGIIKKAHAYADRHGVIRPIAFTSGPWKVYGTTGGSASAYTMSLFHYSTEMLRWRYSYPSREVQIIGTWTGWGSVSDQTGVNAALSALGSTMRYSRDIRGGGPRINPYAMRAGGGIRPQTPPVY
jgi:hypothetical protein